jgi:hypothetical protein
MPRSIDWLAPSSNSLTLNMLNELATTNAHAKTHCLCLCMVKNNCSKISSLVEEEELEPSHMELKSWLEDEATSSK